MRLSDYQGEEAIELWADLLDPLSNILTDEDVRKVIKSGKAPIVIAKVILHDHSDDVKKILLRIDPAPLNGLNILLRLISVIRELEESDEIKSFFGFSAQEKTDIESSGSPTENIEVEEN